MESLSQTVAAKARKIEGELLRRIAEHSQTRLADQLGLDDSSISRWLASEGGFKRACEVLAALRLRLKPDDEPDFSDSYVGALETLARVQLDERRKVARPGVGESA